MEEVAAVREVVQVVIGDNNEILKCVDEDGQPYVIPQIADVKSPLKDQPVTSADTPGDDEDCYGEELMKADAVRLLLSMIPDCMDKNKRSPRIFTMMRVWETIHKEFEAQGHPYTVFQIRNKWTTLTRAYRNCTKDDNSKKPRKRCPFYKELTQLMNEHPDLRPVILRPTKSQDVKSEDDDDDNDDDDANNNSADDVMSNKAVRLLISQMVDGLTKKKSSKTMSMKEVFDKVKLEFESNGYKYTRVQICNKWKTLRRAYHRVMNRDRRRKGPKTCPFQSELTAGLSKCPDLMKEGHQENARTKLNLRSNDNEDEEEEEEEEKYQLHGGNKRKKRACVVTPNRKRCYSPSEEHSTKKRQKKVAPAPQRRNPRLRPLPRRKVSSADEEEDNELGGSGEEETDFTSEAIRVLISMMPACIRRKRTSRNYMMSDVWVTIQTELERLGHPKYLPAQIRNKWKTLERGYKRAHVRRERGVPGRYRNNCAYEKELDEALSIYSKIMPSLMTAPEKRGLDIYDGEADDDSCATPNVGEQASLPVQDRGSWFWDGQERYLSSRGEWKKRVTVASELKALRALITDNYEKKREESARRHNEKLALLAELFGRGQDKLNLK